MNRSRRHSTITVRDVDGVVHQGAGENMAQAARQLGERHAAEQLLRERAAELDALMLAGCRHCGEPVHAGAGGGVFRARLAIDEPAGLYAAHIGCQTAALERLAVASHDAVTSWRLTPAGAALLAAETGR